MNIERYIKEEALKLKNSRRTSNEFTSSYFCRGTTSQI